MLSSGIGSAGFHVPLTFILADGGSFVLICVCISPYIWKTALIMSHSLLWRRIVLLTVGVYSSNHRVLPLESV